MITVYHIIYTKSQHTFYKTKGVIIYKPKQELNICVLLPSTKLHNKNFGVIKITSALLDKQT